MIVACPYEFMVQIEKKNGKQFSKQFAWCVCVIYLNYVCSNCGRINTIVEQEFKSRRMSLELVDYVKICYNFF